MRNACFAFTIIAASLAPALAIDEPPITSPQDATCRDEARDTVFSAPNPTQLSPYDLGAKLYHACMRRLHAERDVPPTRR